jgi:hypothetical protein
VNFEKLARWFQTNGESLAQNFVWFVAICQLYWKVANKSRDGLFVTDWQMDEMLEFLLESPHIVYWDWCRNSGKTEKATVLVVFLNMMDIEMTWFSKSTKQLMRSQKLLNRNPFVKPFHQSRVRTEFQLVDKRVVTIGVLIKEDNAAGPHPMGGVYDEFAEMQIEFMQKSFGMYPDDPYLLFISTPIANSPTTAIRQKYRTHTHTYKDLPWRNPKMIEQLCLPGQEALWAQEWMCVELAPEGCIFTNIIHTTVFPALSEMNWIRQGLDYGSDSWNIGVRLGWCNGMFWLLDERAFAYAREDAKLQEYCDKYPTEGELGGWNKLHAPSLQRITSEDFSQQTGATKLDNLKRDRIENILSAPICVNRSLTPHTIDQMGRTFWGADKRVDTKDLHNIAALLHAANLNAQSYRKAEVQVQAESELPHFLRVRQ